jgi:hypothetical protein
VLKKLSLFSEFPEYRRSRLVERRARAPLACGISLASTAI